MAAKITHDRCLTIVSVNDDYLVKRLLAPTIRTTKDLGALVTTLDQTMFL